MSTVAKTRAFATLFSSHQAPIPPSSFNKNFHDFFQAKFYLAEVFCTKGQKTAGEAFHEGNERGKEHLFAFKGAENGQSKGRGEAKKSRANSSAGVRQTECEGDFSRRMRRSFGRFERGVNWRQREMISAGREEEMGTRESKGGAKEEQRRKGWDQRAPLPKQTSIFQLSKQSFASQYTNRHDEFL